MMVEKACSSPGLEALDLTWRCAVSVPQHLVKVSDTFHDRGRNLTLRMEEVCWSTTAIADKFGLLVNSR
jgi:hypothetical protein